MKIRQIEDYVDRVQEKFPELSKKDIKKILTFGMKSFYLHNLYGADVLLKSPVFTLYSGKFFSSNLLFYSYWRIKHKIKDRILYKRNKIKYDGYYYFGLNENRNDEYLSQFKQYGRKKSTANLDNIVASKIFSEVEKNHSLKHIYRLKYKYDRGFLLRLNSFETEISNIEYIYKRDEDNNLISI